MQDYPVGQPPKLLKPGVKEKILAALSKGATYHLACGYAGIAYNTFREYIKKGEKLLDLFEEQIDIHPDKIYYEFYCDVKRVESYAAIKWLEKIDRASEIHWQAAAWKLERRHPDDYGKQINEQKVNLEDELLRKAQEEVLKLKKEAHDRSESQSTTC
jgi:transposase